MALILFLTAVLIVSLGGTVVEADETVMQFDDGTTALTTVIGLYTDNGGWYHEATDFTLNSVEAIANPRILAHVHVGSKIQPLPNEDACRMGIRVNDGPWYWVDLEPYKNDGNHWLEFQTSPDDWRSGTNRVVTTSTVANKGNMTPESLDMLGSVSPQPSQRSYYTQNLKSYRLSNDRNWGMRLKYDSLDRVADVTTVELLSSSQKLAVNKPNQLKMICRNQEGETVPCNEAIWSATGGVIDPWGLYTPFHEGSHCIKARVGEVTGELWIDVRREYPLGIEPPTSPERLGPQIPEGHLSLCGEWSFMLDASDIGVSEEWFRTEPKQSWGTIHVPGCWQAQGWGLFNHGIGWYKRQFRTPEDWSGNRVWLRFGAVATEATVWVNGVEVGKHLGDWTPFEMEVTDRLNPDAPNILVVRVKELPNYFGAGFPRVIGQLGGCDSHFGGIWQEVSLIKTGNIHIQDVHVSPSLKQETVKVTVSIESDGQSGEVEMEVFSPDGQSLTKETLDLSGQTEIEHVFTITDPQPWTPEEPNLYRAVVTVTDLQGRRETKKVPFGMRDVQRQGSKILLNGRAIIVRGALHWAYYPDLFTADPSEERIRKEFQDLRDAGFNLVKVCLFMFPKRYYEIADEVGMLLWQEYPTWHTIPQEGFTGDTSAFVAEYEEWIRLDRNHPSVILRDLTCESPKPDRAFMSTVYEMCKEMTDGALIEDNSNMLDQVFTDWYDGHFYRDLDDFLWYCFPWLVQHLRERPETKPYLTGEDYDFDTYRDLRAIREANEVQGELPWWLDNGNFLDQEDFDAELEKEHPGMVEALIKSQKERGLFFRKTVWEAFRSYPELTGYVMTGIRDNTSTRPGFYDDLMEPKWSPEQWTPFNSDRILILDMDQDSHCYWDNEAMTVKILLSNFGEEVDEARLTWRILEDDEILMEDQASAGSPNGAIIELCSKEIQVSAHLHSEKTPVQLSLEAKLDLPNETLTNQWDIWIFPKSREFAPGTQILIHSGKDSKEFAEKLALGDARTLNSTSEVDNSVLISDALDEETLGYLERGGKVLYLGPNAEGPSLPYHGHRPFWRETALPILDGHPFWGDFPHGRYIGRPFLSMTQRQPFDTRSFSEVIEPLLRGLNPRNPRANPVDYIFETKVSKGKMLGCCLIFDGPEPTAGRYLLGNLIEYLASQQCAPTKQLPIDRLRELCSPK